MLHNPAKAKLLAGYPAYGYSLAFGSPLVAEAMSGTGIDFVMIDTQHGSFGADAVIASLIGITAGGSVPMARVARNDYTLIGRLLDDGALGIVVPMVDTAQDAKRAADACRLPPVGTRSWGWGRAARYGPDYPDHANAEIFLAVQIESITAVENAEAILATPEEWETVLSGTSEGGPVRLQLPPRRDGHWLLWFSSLPLQGDGAYWVTIGEITFNR